MIHFDALDFSERRPEEVVSFDAQCSYNIITFNLRIRRDCGMNKLKIWHISHGLKCVSKNSLCSMSTLYTVLYLPTYENYL